jgi:hypothetical protein
LLDDRLKSTLTVCPSVLSNFKYWGTRPYDKKVGPANSEKEFSEITENNKSRKIKEFKSKAETALWFVESYGLVPQYLKLESTDGHQICSW